MSPSSDRNLNVLDLQPDWTEPDGKGDMLGVLTAEVAGNVEEFILATADLKILVVKALAALVYTDERAVKIALDNFQQDAAGLLPWEPDRNEGKKFSTWREDEAARGVPIPVRAKVISSVSMRRRGTRKFRSFPVIGGYSAARLKVLLLLRVEAARPMSLFLVMHGNRLTIIPASSEGGYLPPEAWEKFLKLRPSTAFSLGGKNWKKMSPEQICKLLRGKQFVWNTDLRKAAKEVPSQKKQEPTRSKSQDEQERDDDDAGDDGGGVVQTTAKDSESASVIELPPFALQLVSQQACPYCRIRFDSNDAIAIGIRRPVRRKQTYFFYELECRKCKDVSHSTLLKHPMSARQLGDLFR